MPTKEEKAAEKAALKAQKLAEKEAARAAKAAAKAAKAAAKEAAKKGGKGKGKEEAAVASPAPEVSAVDVPPAAAEEQATPATPPVRRPAPILAGPDHPFASEG